MSRNPNTEPPQPGAPDELPPTHAPVREPETPQPAGDPLPVEQPRLL